MRRFLSSPTLMDSVMGTLGGVFESLYAVDFDGVDDYVTAGSPSALDNIFDGGGTVGGWIYARSDGENNLSRIFDKWAGYRLYMLSESASKVKIRLDVDFSSQDGRWESTSTEIDINTWTHIIVIYDGSSTSNNPIIYINSSPITLTESITPIGTISSDSTSNLYIGNDSTQSYTFDGLLDDLFIVNRILTASEVTEAYNGGSPYDLSGASFWSDVVAWWKMGDGDTYPLLQDSTATGFGSDLVTNGDFSAWTGDNPDGWTVTEVGDSTSNITENPSGQCQIISDGTQVGINQPIISIGDLFYYSIDVISLVSGGLWLGFGTNANDVFIDSVGTYTGYYIGHDGDRFHIKRSAACDITIDNIIVQRANGNHGIMTNMTAGDIVGRQ